MGSFDDAVPHFPIQGLSFLTPKIMGDGHLSDPAMQVTDRALDDHGRRSRLTTTLKEACGTLQP